MQIIDLPEKYEQLYLVCLEDWSDEIKEAGDHRSVWYHKMKDKGLRVKLALDDRGEVGGMIHYTPIEQAFAEGKNLYFINCIWVHGHKKGRGNFQKLGMGTALLKAAEDDARALGARGIAAWGVPLPFWMKASWFKKHGYQKTDSTGFLGQQLLWKQFSNDAQPPVWIKPKKKPGTVPGKVTITAFLNGWCTSSCINYERARRAADEFGDKVIFQGIDTFDRNTFLDWGISDALYIDGKEVRTGPPPTYAKIRKLLAKKVEKL